MKFTRYMLTGAALCLLSLPVQALDLSNMTDAERAAFQAEVRAYLVQNPEVLMEAFNVLEARQAQQQNVSDKTLVQDNSAALFSDGRSFVGGNPDGDITLVEFMDYRCGYCRKAHDEVAELVKSDGNIRFIVKEFPILGEDSVTSSRFAIATRNVAGPEAYARVNEALIKLPGAVNDAALKRIARNAGIDADAVMAAMNSDAVNTELTANHALAQVMQINGTPTFILSDEVLRGYVPLASMQEIVTKVRAN